MKSKSAVSFRQSAPFKRVFLSRVFAVHCDRLFSIIKRDLKTKQRKTKKHRMKANIRMQEKKKKKKEEKKIGKDNATAKKEEQESTV